MLERKREILRKQWETLPAEARRVRQELDSATDAMLRAKQAAQRAGEQYDKALERLESAKDKARQYAYQLQSEFADELLATAAGTDE
jgi:uncharacterized protein (DUF3084 family)